MQTLENRSVKLMSLLILMLVLGSVGAITAPPRLATVDVPFSSSGALAQQAVITDTTGTVDEPLDPMEQAEVDLADGPPEVNEPDIVSPYTGAYNLFLPFASNVTSIQQDAISSNSLAGYWQLSDSGGRRDDQSGRSNDLTPVNNPVRAPGKAGQAIDLEASDKQYLYIDDSDQKGLDITGSLTLMGWFRIENPNGSYRILASKYSFGDRNQRGYRLDLRDGSKKIGFIASPNGKFSNNFLLQKELPSQLKRKQWYHIAAVFDASSQKMRLYLNCEQIGSRSVNHNKIHNSNAPFMLGANEINGKPSSYFDGRLDDWQVYSRVLSKNEIAQSCTTGGVFEAPDEPDPAPSPSNSSCNPSNGRGGLQPGSYVRSVAGLQAGIIVGKGYNPNKPTYLAFYLPGDNGNAWQAFANQPKGPVAKFIDDQSWVYVSPKHPNGKSWWKDWNGDHVKKFERVLDEMFNKYNLCRNVIFGGGGSGGSEFFTRQFFPVKGKKFPSHNVILCGGNDPSLSKLKNIAKSNNAVQRSEFHFVYGTADRLVPLIKDAISVYRKAGFKVTTKVYSNKGHCNKWTSEGIPGVKDQLVTNWTRMARNEGVYR